MLAMALLNVPVSLGDGGLKAMYKLVSTAYILYCKPQNLAIFPIGRVYALNSFGPRIELWGTPYL